jgi:hypothetical protein
LGDFGELRGDGRHGELPVGSETNIRSRTPFRFDASIMIEAFTTSTVRPSSNGNLRAIATRLAFVIDQLTGSIRAKSGS